MRTLHPKMVAHGLKVQAAHTELSKSVSGFKKLPMPTKMKMIQQHIKAIKA